MNDRVSPVDKLQIWVVDAPPQVISDLVVGRERHPGQLRLPAFLRLGEEERDLLPVAFMIIYATEGRSPVIHRVKNQYCKIRYPASRTARMW
jgi:hypothetical protein